MIRPGTFLKGGALGAGMMYLFDPERGRRRRALVRDRLIGAVNGAEAFFDRACRDLINRFNGLAAHSANLFRHDHASDDVIAERVRSKMGRYVSHPHAVSVAVEDGHVILSGPILAQQVSDFVSAVRKVRGVCGVENRLDVHHSAGDISALQGGVRRPGERFELRQRTWSPATKLLIGAAGAGLLMNVLDRKAATALVLSALGLATVGHGMAHPPANAGGKSNGRSARRERAHRANGPHREPART